MVCHEGGPTVGPEAGGLPPAPVTLPSVGAMARQAGCKGRSQPPVACGINTVPWSLNAFAASPLGSTWRMTFPHAESWSWKVSVQQLATPRYKSPLVWTRPAKLRLGLLKKPRSLSENTPNWNTGISATSTAHDMLTSSPTVPAPAREVVAVTCRLTGSNWA